MFATPPGQDPIPWALTSVPLAGGEMAETIINEPADYLQICGDNLYFCNSDYRFCRAGLYGDDIEVLFDKEVYFPYMLDEEWLEEDLGVAAVKGPSGATDIVLIDYNDEIGLYILNIFNEKAISSGLLEEYVGDDYGDTAAEVWYNLFGRSI